MSSFLSFHLSDQFVAKYEDKPIPWGFDIGGGNSLGETVFYTNYSRVKADGTKERWPEVCRRVVEGMYSILKDHCLQQRTPWNHNKAQRSAEEAYDRLFHLQWTPPGRGLWCMGTELVNGEKNSAALQNCGFLSTQSLTVRDPGLLFGRLMDMSMHGIGLGFDTLGAGGLVIQEPAEGFFDFQVPDTREGWVESIDILLQSFLKPGRALARFDYSLLRPQGAPLKRFGGFASGPDPLREVHETIVRLLSGRSGELVTTRDITDIFNLVGKCVVAGGARRSAELALGQPDDTDFISLKNWALPENAERTGADGWSWLSNNSVEANVAGDYSHLVDGIVLNGEPGLVYLDMCRAYGRLKDGVNNKDHRVAGVNPCGEQTLEHWELCTLVEVHLPNHKDLEDFNRSLKFAYLYGKAVTLLPTHWPETNEVMTRNRRIGTSITGIVQFIEENHSIPELRSWLDSGYDEVTNWDVRYSEWLGVRESIKRTSVKPSGSVSLLSGVTPGAHWPVAAGRYFRRQRLAITHPMVAVLRAAGYHIEPAYGSEKTTVVVKYPVIGPDIRSQSEVSLWEKASLAAELQYYWSDNAVSVTLTFDPETEAEQVGPVISAFQGKLKAMSFLAIDPNSYPQMPYEAIDESDTQAVAEFDHYLQSLDKIDMSSLYLIAEDAISEKYCTTDSCEI